MKTLINTLLVASALIVGGNAFAKSDSELISACKAQVVAEYGEVDRIKVANINSKRTVFKAKLKIKANGEKSLYSCEIRRQEPAVVACLKGACDAGKVAAN